MHLTDKRTKKKMRIYNLIKLHGNERIYQKICHRKYKSGTSYNRENENNITILLKYCRVIFIKCTITIFNRKTWRSYNIYILCLSVDL